MPGSLPRVTMAGHGGLALSCSHLAPLADQEHGLLQAGGEWGEGRGGHRLPGTPDVSLMAGHRSSTAGKPWPGPG